jgi:hypothetical protein
LNKLTFVLHVAHYLAHQFFVLLQLAALILAALQDVAYSLGHTSVGRTLILNRIFRTLAATVRHGYSAGAILNLNFIHWFAIVLVLDGHFGVFWDGSHISCKGEVDDFCIIDSVSLPLLI